MVNTNNFTEILNEVKEKFPQIYCQHSSCKILYCIIEDREKREHINFFSIVLFSDKTIKVTEEINKHQFLDETLESRIKLNEIFNILFLEQQTTIKDFEDMISNYNGNTIKLPKDEDKLRIKIEKFGNPNKFYECDVREQNKTIFSKDDWCSFIQINTTDGFDYIKEILSSEEIIYKCIKLIRARFGLNLINFLDFIGGLIIIIPDKRIMVDWRGTPDGENFIIRIDNKTDKEFINRLKITVYNEENKTFIEKGIKGRGEVKKRNVFRGLSPGLRCKVEIFDEETKELIFKDIATLIKEIKINNMGIITTEKEIILLNKEGKEIERVNIPMISPANEVIKPDWMDSKEILRVIDLENELYNKKILSIDRGDDKSKIFLRDIIKNAMGYIKILDPYFRSNDFYIFATMTGSKSAKVRIITELRNAPYEEKKRYEEKREELLKLIIELREKLKLNIECKIKHGQRGFSFHDRFIFTDKKGWIIGKSFNVISKTSDFGIIYKIDDKTSNIIEMYFDDLWKSLPEIENG
jgi:hypothetical protein